MQGITARQMTLGLILKQRKGERLVTPEHQRNELPRGEPGSYDSALAIKAPRGEHST
jgi:hypothetical protein